MLDLNTFYKQKSTFVLKGPSRERSIYIMKSRSRKFDQLSLNKEVKKIEAYKGITGSGKTNDKLRMVMWNVNGIRSVISKLALRDLIGQYAPDFICVNQTKINSEIYAKENINIHGYFGYWNFCKCSAGYSGVAVFSKFQPLSIFEDLEEPEHSQEGRVLTLQYEQFYLVVVYMPSAGDRQLKRLQYKIQKYQVAFHKHCQKLKSRGKGVIVCGDMNVSPEKIDLHWTPYSQKQPGFTPAERNSFKRFLHKGWVDTFRRLNPTLQQYTWWRLQHKNRERGIGKRLDYFLVNEEFFWTVKKSMILGDVLGSDHCPIYLEINISPQIKPQEKVQDLLKPIKQIEQAKETKKDIQEHTEEHRDGVDKENCAKDALKQQNPLENAQKNVETVPEESVSVNDDPVSN